MLPPATGCGGREVGRWLVVALEHLELAAQPRSRRSCEAMVSGRNGTATAQPARTTKTAAPAANFKVFQFADVSIMLSPPLSDAFCSSVWLRWFNCGLFVQEERTINFNAGCPKHSKREWLVKRPIAGFSSEALEIAPACRYGYYNGSRASHLIVNAPTIGALAADARSEQGVSARGLEDLAALPCRPRDGPRGAALTCCRRSRSKIRNAESPSQ
jgi:hypothetical protein